MQGFDPHKVTSSPEQRVAQERRDLDVAVVRAPVPLS